MSKNSRNSTFFSSPAVLQPAEIRRQYDPLPSIMRTVVTSVTTDTPYTQAEAEQLRADYLLMIEHPDWKEQMLKLAESIQTSLAEAQDKNEVQEDDKGEDYTIKYDGQIYTFSSDQKAITVGRKQECDIRLAENDTTASRLHLIIFPLKDRVLIVDPGSLFGIKTEKRGQRSKKLEHSL